jgi:Uma2 family endonuclease
MTTSATDILVLESGAHLTRAEFYRRYCASPRKFEAESVERVVYVASPVSRRHGLSHAVAMAWLSLYWERHPEGAPQLVGEIAASSASYNLHEKLRVYRRNGVPEYVV